MTLMADSSLDVRFRAYNTDIHAYSFNVMYWQCQYDTDIDRIYGTDENAGFQVNPLSGYCHHHHHHHHRFIIYMFIYYGVGK